MTLNFEHSSESILKFLSERRVSLLDQFKSRFDNSFKILQGNKLISIIDDDSVKQALLRDSLNTVTFVNISNFDEEPRINYDEFIENRNKALFSDSEQSSIMEQKLTSAQDKAAHRYKESQISIITQDQDKASHFSEKKQSPNETAQNQNNDAKDITQREISNMIKNKEHIIARGETVRHKLDTINPKLKSNIKSSQGQNPYEDENAKFRKQVRSNIKEISMAKYFTDESNSVVPKSSIPLSPKNKAADISKERLANQDQKAKQPEKEENTELLNKFVKQVVGQAKVSQDEFYKPDPRLHNDAIDKVTKGIKQSVVNKYSHNNASNNQLSQIFQTDRNEREQDNLLVEQQKDKINYSLEYDKIKEKNTCSTNQNDENNSESEGMQIDWSKIPLFDKALECTTEFNCDRDELILSQLELPKLIDALQEREKDYKDYEILLPVHVKSIKTLELLLQDLGFSRMLSKYLNRYLGVTVSNTTKILLLCQVHFQLRKNVLAVFEVLIDREKVAEDLKQKLGVIEEEFNDPKEEAQMKEMFENIIDLSINALKSIKIFRQSNKNFDVEFIFKGKDIERFIKRENNQIKKLMFTFDITSEEEIVYA